MALHPLEWEGGDVKRVEAWIWERQGEIWDWIACLLGHGREMQGSLETLVEA